MPASYPLRQHRFAIRALTGLTVLWLVFALFSGAEQQGGLPGLVRHSPNALPWVAVLALVWGANRWPLPGGLAIFAVALASLIGLETWHHPVTFALITVPYAALGAWLVANAWRG